MSSSNTYYKELQDDNTTETAQLMANTVSSTTTTTSTGGEANLAVLTDDMHQTCTDTNGTIVNGDCCLLKPDHTEMSTSTTSLKCCTGLFNQKRKFKIVKETQTVANGNGTACNGATKNEYWNTLKEKFHANGAKIGANNGTTCHNKTQKCPKVKVEKIKKTKIVEDRDPTGIQTNLTFEFQNVFAEPNTGTFSFNPIWSFTNQMYFHMKLFLYRLLAFVIGIPAAFIWAIMFAIFSVFQIWLWNPLFKLFKALFALVRDVWATIIDTVFGPIFQLFQFIRWNQTGNATTCNV